MPDWWDWDLELSHHLIKRMQDRHFSEVDLRLMMEMASGLRVEMDSGRWIVETQHNSQPWEVVVEPDFDEQVLVVITAFPVE